MIMPLNITIVVESRTIDFIYIATFFTANDIHMYGIAWLFLIIAFVSAVVGICREYSYSRKIDLLIIRESLKKQGNR